MAWTKYKDNPYGHSFNMVSGNPRAINPVPTGIFNQARDMGLTWMRIQADWDLIELVQGTFTWTPIDTVVAKANSYGINVSFVLQKAPTWAIDTSICSGANYPRLTTPTNACIQNYASVAANRYNGGANGSIQCFEILNELYDDQKYACRDGSYSAAALKACYGTIKAINPNMLVGSSAQYIQHQTQAHEQAWWQSFYTNNGHKYCDFMNYHWYSVDGISSPDTANSPTGVVGMTYDQVWQTIRGIAPNDKAWTGKGCWVTETGYQVSAGGSSTTITPTQLDQYSQSLLSKSKNSGFIKKYYWFNLGTFSIPGSGNPPQYYSPAYGDYKAFIANNPSWGAGGGTPGILSSNPTSFSNGSYSESITLTNSAGGAAITWTATSDTAGTTFTPSSGTLNAGQTVSVAITIPATVIYPTGVNLTFSATNNTITVPWSSVSSGGGQPGILVAQPTSFSDGAILETVTLTNPANSTSSITWTASCTTAGVAFSPSSGTLAPGASTAVAVTLPSGTNCNPAVNFVFTATNNTVTVPWSCPGGGPPPPVGTAFNRRYSVQRPR